MSLFVSLTFLVTDIIIINYLAYEQVFEFFLIFFNYFISFKRILDIICCNEPLVMNHWVCYYIIYKQCKYINPHIQKHTEYVTIKFLLSKQFSVSLCKFFVLLIHFWQCLPASDFIWLSNYISLGYLGIALKCFCKSKKKSMTNKIKRNKYSIYISSVTLKKLTIKTILF